MFWRLPKLESWLEVSNDISVLAPPCLEDFLNCHSSLVLLPVACLHKSALWDSVEEITEWAIMQVQLDYLQFSLKKLDLSPIKREVEQKRIFCESGESTFWQCWGRVSQHVPWRVLQQAMKMSERRSLNCGLIKKQSRRKCDQSKAFKA